MMPSTTMVPMPRPPPPSPIGRPKPPPPPPPPPSHRQSWEFSLSGTSSRRICSSSPPLNTRRPAHLSPLRQRVRLRTQTRGFAFDVRLAAPPRQGHARATHGYLLPNAFA